MYPSIDFHSVLPNTSSNRGLVRALECLLDLELWFQMNVTTVEKFVRFSELWGPVSHGNRFDRTTFFFLSRQA